MIRALSSKSTHLSGGRTGDPRGHQRLALSACAATPRHAHAELLEGVYRACGIGQHIVTDHLRKAFVFGAPIAALISAAGCSVASRRHPKASSAFMASTMRLSSRRKSAAEN